jgi:hypothetical protein
VHPGLIDLIRVARNIGDSPKFLEAADQSRPAQRFAIIVNENICRLMLLSHW